MFSAHDCLLEVVAYHPKTTHCTHERNKLLEFIPKKWLSIHRILIPGVTRNRQVPDISPVCDELPLRKTRQWNSPWWARTELLCDIPSAQKYVSFLLNSSNLMSFSE